MSLDQKILVVDQMHDSIHEVLRSIGFECSYRPEITRKEIIQILPDYVGLIIRSKTAVDHELILKAENLRFIGRAGAGVDNIDVNLLDKKNITLFNTPEGNRDAVGEHGVGMLLMLLNKLRLADMEVRSYRWDRESNRGYELKNKVVGIFGFGFMGSAFAEKLRGFDCDIIAYDKYKKAYTSEINYVKEVDLIDFKRRTEVLSIHIPLTFETSHLFNYDFLSSFQNLKYLINMARGEVLSLKGLNEILYEGNLRGAALDVLENEKLNTLTSEEQKIYQSLFEHQHTLFSPHIAGWTYESYERINQVLAKKISEMKF
jgi:D-3-phosphoglycerate dehydrogenase|tara:strand:+ start:1430 stop:2377 length:948 start_codon:yes stop_codon:yes gene_type:complete